MLFHFHFLKVLKSYISAECITRWSWIEATGIYPQLIHQFRIGHAAVFKREHIIYYTIHIYPFYFYFFDQRFRNGIVYRNTFYFKIASIFIKHTGYRNVLIIAWAERIDRWEIGFVIWIRFRFLWCPVIDTT